VLTLVAHKMYADEDHPEGATIYLGEF
jgi:hypothetical protein